MTDSIVHARRRGVALFPLRLVLAGIAVMVLGGAIGCANGEIRMNDPFDREYSLETLQHHYTVLIRWSQFQKAKAYVAKDEQPAFIERMKLLDEARFTDYESDPIELDESMRLATVRVRYTLYLPATPFEIEVTETQEWTRTGRGNGWQVHSVFEGVPEYAAN
jgi:hypothetical protein